MDPRPDYFLTHILASYCIGKRVQRVAPSSAGYSKKQLRRSTLFYLLFLFLCGPYDRSAEAMCFYVVKVDEVGFCFKPHHQPRPSGRPTTPNHRSKGGLTQCHPSDSHIITSMRGRGSNINRYLYDLDPARTIQVSYLELLSSLDTKARKLRTLARGCPESLLSYNNFSPLHLPTRIVPSPRAAPFKSNIWIRQWQYEACLDFAPEAKSADFCT